MLQPPDPALEVVVDGGEGPPAHRHEGEEGEEREHEVGAAAHPDG